MAVPASEPDGQRSWVGTTIAARALRCSDETVKRQVKAGVLEGGRRSNGHWYVYKDQIASEDEKQLRQENAALRRRVAELTAAASDGAGDDVRRQLAAMENELAKVRRNELALQDENRELLRANQIQQTALSEMGVVLDEYLEGGEFALKSSEFALNAAGKFQSAGKKLSRVNATIATGTNSYPVGVAVNPAGTFAYVTNSNSKSVSVIAL